MFPGEHVREKALKMLALSPGMHMPAPQGLRKRVCTLLDGVGTLQKWFWLTETLEHRACSRMFRIKYAVVDVL